MRVVAVTGNPASGKSTVLSILKKYGVPGHSADAAVEHFYKTEADKIRARFNASSKEEMMKILASNPHLWQQLESMIYPFVKARRQKFLDSHKSQPVVLCEVPLLFERSMEVEFDLVLLLVAPLEIRRNRFNSQWFPVLEKRFFSQGKKMFMAQEVIFNDKSLEVLERELLNFIQRVLFARIGHETVS